MTVRFPIAVNAEAALAAPLGAAARQRDAEMLLSGPAVFTRELTGPVFETRDAALAAYRGRVDVEGQSPVPPEDRFCDLVEVLAPGKGALSGQAAPVHTEGRRWPQPRALLDTGWRLSVGYWRPVAASHPGEQALAQARRARRSGGAEKLDANALRRMAQQPLKPVEPQKPLDFGLFEAPLPESPGQFIPDE